MNDTWLLIEALFRRDHNFYLFISISLLTLLIITERVALLDLLSLEESTKHTFFMKRHINVVALVRTN